MRYRAIPTILLLAASSLVTSTVTAEVKIVSHGPEQVIKVKKKPQRFFAAAPDGTWHLTMKGPAKLAIAIRAVIDSKLPEGIMVIADLDGQSISSTPLTIRVAKDATLAGLEKNRALSQEQVLLYEISSGDHTLTVSLDGGRQAFLRHVAKTPPKTKKAAPFVAKPAVTPTPRSAGRRPTPWARSAGRRP